MIDVNKTFYTESTNNTQCSVSQFVVVYVTKLITLKPDSDPNKAKASYTVGLQQRINNGPWLNMTLLRRFKNIDNVTDQQLLGNSEYHWKLISQKHYEQLVTRLGL